MYKVREFQEQIVVLLEPKLPGSISIFFSFVLRKGDNDKNEFKKNFFSFNKLWIDFNQNHYHFSQIKFVRMVVNILSASGKKYLEFVQARKKELTTSQRQKMCFENLKKTNKKNHRSNIDDKHTHKRKRISFISN